MNTNNNVELLAPAGSFEGFMAALGAGADAVYVGGPLFGARAYARNFTEEELLEAIDTAHLHDRKLYLTVNTLLKNKELYGNLYEYLAPLYERGLDAVIVQDIGVFQFIKENFPGLHLHASTQMAISGPAGMSFLEKLGASRVVAARELTLDELSEMHRESPIEIEAFIHGALCYSYSGLCLMSSILGGRSGNRGRCAQPCRLAYETAPDKNAFRGKKQKCPLSLKDLNTIELLPEIINAGVTSLKIEGRMKQPQYTAGVTAVYRKYLDLFLDKGADNYHVEEKDKQALLEIFSRGGSCQGYYVDRRGPAMIDFCSDKKTRECDILLSSPKEKISGKLSLVPGEPARLEISLKDHRASVSAGEVQQALSQPMDPERIRKQMDKLGGTAYQWENLEIETQGNIFVPVKLLNEIRREGIADLEYGILSPYRRTLSGKPQASGNMTARRRPTAHLPLYASCENVETAKCLLREDGLTGLYVPYSAVEECLSENFLQDKKIFLALPHMLRGQIPENAVKKILNWMDRGLSGILVRNYESFAVMKEWGLAEKCIADAALYSWNNAAVDFWKGQGVQKNTIPLELNEGELRHRDNSDSEMIVYGYLPMMISAQCVRKNNYSCTGKEGYVYLKDRYDKVFPVSCCCDYWKTETTKHPMPCYNIIYNSLPYGLLKEKRQVEALSPASVRLSFTLETPSEAAEIFRAFRKVYHENGNPAEYPFTKGHFKRGAE